MKMIIILTQVRTAQRAALAQQKAEKRRRIVNRSGGRRESRPPVKYQAVTSAEHNMYHDRKHPAYQKRLMDAAMVEAMEELEQGETAL